MIARRWFASAEQPEFVFGLFLVFGPLTPHMVFLGLLLFLVFCLSASAALLRIQRTARLRRTDGCQHDCCQTDLLLVRAKSPALRSATGPPGRYALWRRSDLFLDPGVWTLCMIPAVQLLHHDRPMMSVAIW
jgi:hypothetical protein